MSKVNIKKKKLSPEQHKKLLNILKTRFEKNMNRHKGLEWDKVTGKAGCASWRRKAVVTQ